MNFDNDFEDDDAPRRGHPKHAAKVAPEVGEDVQRRMAAMQVRRKTDQHQCTARADGTCAHPNHRRDMDFLGEMLAMIGLDGDYPAYTAADNRTWLRWIGQSGPAEDQAA